MSRHSYCERCNGCFSCDTGVYRVRDNCQICYRCYRQEQIEVWRAALEIYADDRSSRGQLAREVLAKFAFIEG